MSSITPRLAKAALVTQMRAGTHFFCGALRVSLRATIYRPDREHRYVIMSDDYILQGLHPHGRFTLPPSDPQTKLYFHHYYHPQLEKLESMPRIYLIGFPFDSFYSDGVVVRTDLDDPGPSGPRASGYVLRFHSREWILLEQRMLENAAWLMRIAEAKDALIIRYEDFFLDFDTCERRISRFVGGLLSPMPKPMKNSQRKYWTDDYQSGFDEAALKALWQYFEPSIGRFYPEKFDFLKSIVV